jgi:flagellar basal body-associated protein FliL
MTVPVAPQAPAPRRGGSRWLVGCLGVVLVLVLIVGVAGWWFVVRPLQQAAAAVEEVARIQELDARVTNRAPFTPPDDAELSQADVDRYVAVLRSVRSDLDRNLQTLEQRYADLDGRAPELMDIPRLASAYLDLFRLLVQAKEAQVEALNDHGFSVAEYQWVRSQVLAAIGLPGVGYDLGGFAQAFVDGRDPTAAGVATAPSVPSANRELVEPYADELDDVAFLVLLGL